EQISRLVQQQGAEAPQAQPLQRRTHLFRDPCRDIADRRWQWRGLFHHTPLRHPAAPARGLPTSTPDRRIKRLYSPLRGTTRAARRTIVAAASKGTCPVTLATP